VYSFIYLLRRTYYLSQIHTFYSQAAVLSAEADQSRRNAIAAMFPAVSFVDPTFDCSLRFVNPEEIIRALPAVSIKRVTRIFLSISDQDVY
jgi:hypothetical protein